MAQWACVCTSSRTNFTQHVQVWESASLQRSPVGGFCPRRGLVWRRAPFPGAPAVCQWGRVFRFGLKLSSDLFRPIACKIAGTRTSLPIKRKFQLSDFQLSGVDCVCQFVFVHGFVCLRPSMNLYLSVYLSLSICLSVRLPLTRSNFNTPWGGRGAFRQILACSPTRAYA